MQLLGLGIDIIELDRVRKVFARHPLRFVERVLTPRERERARQLRDPTTYLAGRFAAKECILKVLGTGLSQGISWQQVHVIREPSGAPAVYLSGKALERARRMGLGRILVSISHGKDYAIAQALGVRGDPESLRLPGTTEQEPGTTEQETGAPEQEPGTPGQVPGRPGRRAKGSPEP